MFIQTKTSPDYTFYQTTFTVSFFFYSTVSQGMIIISQPCIIYFCFPLPANFFRYTDAFSLKEAVKAVKYKEKTVDGTYTAEAMKAALISYKSKMRQDSKITRVSLRWSKAEKQTICGTE